MVFKKMIQKSLKTIFKKNQTIIYYLSRIENLFSKNINEIYFIFDYLKKNSVRGIMVDVGAHHGQSFRPFVIKNWKIYAFEPDRLNRKELLEAFGSYKNITLENLAVSDSEKKDQPFFSSPISTGISGLSNFHSSHAESSRVDIITLREYTIKKNIKKIDFLKVDAEGFDLFVLRGVPWQKIKPRIILCEYENSKTIPLGYDLNSMCQYLVKKGYKIIVSEWAPIVEYGKKHEWIQLKLYNHAYKQKDNSFGNIIAFRDKSDFQKVASSRIIK